jgi:hypothetical protein
MGKMRFAEAVLHHTGTRQKMSQTEIGARETKAMPASKHGFIKQVCCPNGDLLSRRKARPLQIYRLM